MSNETRSRLIRYSIAGLAVINLIALFVFNYGLKDPSFDSNTDYHSYLEDDNAITDDRNSLTEEENEEVVNE